MVHLNEQMEALGNVPGVALHARPGEGAATASSTSASKNGFRESSRGDGRGGLDGEEMDEEDAEIRAMLLEVEQKEQASALRATEWFK